MVARVRERVRKIDRNGRRTDRQTDRQKGQGVEEGGENKKGVLRRVEQKEKENKRLVHDVTARIRPD